MFRYGLLLAAFVVVADQIAKYIVLGPGQFSPPGCLDLGVNCRVIELTSFFDLRMVWNRGVSFGLMRANTDIVRWALVLLSFVISGVFLWWLRTADRRLTSTALGLVVGGALGNVIDRIRFGAVCDFFDFSGLWFPWVFNVADAAITLGAVLLAVDMVFFTESEPGKGAPWTQLKGRLQSSKQGPGAD
ncbi:MAG: signal peptidase II [Proteobacteria bacterium]|nr:signal peptidase II [Pseudomonadota bacterium]